MLDRIDIHLGIDPVKARALANGSGHLFRGETRAARARIAAARAAQGRRATGLGVAASNARLTPAELERAAPLDDASRSLLAGAVERLGMSARGYHRAWRLARTLADLGDRRDVGPQEVSEALTLREVR
jgi:magnesium chelatase family protein